MNGIPENFDPGNMFPTFIYTRMGLTGHTRILEPHPRLIVMGYSVRKANAIGSARGTLHTDTENGPVNAVFFHLTSQAQVETKYFGERGLRFPQGVDVAIESGAVDLSVFYKVTK